MIPRFRCYLFDVDGTLLDSAGDICAAAHQVLLRRGRDSLPDEYIRSGIGRHLRESFRDVFPDYTQQEMDSLIEEYRTAYRGRNHRSTRVFAGVRETLATLGGKKATATTKATHTTREVLEQFGLARYFDHIQGTDAFPAKPEPDVVFRALEALSAQPGQCLMVGDSPVDIKAGRRAGVITCAVRYGYGSAQIPESEPDYWIADLRELVS